MEDGENAVGLCYPAACNGLQPPGKESIMTRAGRREADDGRRALDAVRDLRGVGRETFAALGGGERWLRREREAFHDADAETPGEPERPR